MSTFGVDTFVDKYRMWIGLACLATYALLVSHGLFFLEDLISDKREMRRFLREGRECLHNLSPEEKVLLSRYLLGQTKSLRLDPQSGVVNGLEHARIIYQSSTLGTLHGFAYNMQPWALAELKAHPGVLEPELTKMKDELVSRRGRRR